MSKIYVDVLAEFTKEGVLKPREIIWEDGRHYEVDKIIDTRPATSLKAGGAGIRYTCKIQGREKYVFYESNYKWFVEGK
ncbi:MULTISPECIES: hypothetical protein [unclassified Clostridium]|uniref:hypothetical protein n=1 Tax=unclassified Clostridium TaxID=2614128 RepID=UPI003216D5FA